MIILILKNNEQHGPFSEEEALEKMRSGQFNQNDLAWTEGLDEWKPLSGILPHPPVPNPHGPCQATPADLPSTSYKKPLFIACAIICLIFAAMAFLGGESRSSGGDPAAVNVIKRYLAATKWEERLPYVRSPERVKEWMRTHYAPANGKKPFKPLDYQSISAITDLDLPQGFVAFNVVFGKGDEQTYYLQKTSNGYKIDWEMILPNPRSIKAFQTERPTDPEQFRVEAVLSNYYNYEFRKSQHTHFSFKLAIPNTDGDIVTLNAYILRDSEDGEAIYSLLKDGKVHRMILYLRYLEDSENSDIVEIAKFVQPGWIQQQIRRPELQ